MQRSDYIATKKSLDFRPSLWPTALTLVADAMLLACVVALLLNGHWALWLVAQFLLPVIYFHAFSLLHECGHGNIYRGRLVNALLGHILSPLCFLPYFGWKFIHDEHHTWTGNMHRDPTLHGLRKVREAGRVPALARVGWRTWIPIAGVMQHIVYWGYPLRLIAKEGIGSRRSLLAVGSLLYLVTTYAILFSLIPGLALLIWPSFVLYLILVELVNLPHHGDMPVATSEDTRLSPWNQRLATRSCWYPRWFATAVVLNFNFHVEHHYYPTLPWYRLRALRDALAKAGLNHHEELIGISWNVERRGTPASEVVLQERYFDAPQRG